jgi:hypothetical protein
MTLPAMPTKLHLLDTLGPNEAGEEGLKHHVPPCCSMLFRHVCDSPCREFFHLMFHHSCLRGFLAQVERLLDGIGVLVYLLDCNKLKTQEEKQMFQRLKELDPPFFCWVRIQEYLVF